MTIDERLDRIEHATAGIAEERRKDREEYKQLWRETQRQLEAHIAASREADARIAARLEEFVREAKWADEQARDADAKLGKRIEDLVGAVGEFISSQPPR